MNPEVVVPVSLATSRIDSAEQMSDVLSEKLGYLYQRLVPVMGQANTASGTQDKKGEAVRDPSPIVKSIEGLQNRTMQQIASVDVILAQLDI